MVVQFKLDENLPRDAEALLKQGGHQVHSVLDERLGGSTDLQVFEAAQAEERVLVTFDLDFSNIHVYPPASHFGIWVLRPQSQSIESTLSLLHSALQLLEIESTRGRLWIIELDRVRIRE